MANESVDQVTEREVEYVRRLGREAKPLSDEEIQAWIRIEYDPTTDHGRALATIMNLRAALIEVRDKERLACATICLARAAAYGDDPNEQHAAKEAQDCYGAILMQDFLKSCQALEEKGAADGR